MWYVPSEIAQTLQKVVAKDAGQTNGWIQLTLGESIATMGGLNPLGVSDGGATFTRVGGTSIVISLFLSLPTNGGYDWGGKDTVRLGQTAGRLPCQL